MYCLFLILSGSLPLPGFGMLVVASGFLFGFPYGFFLVYPSAVLGACIAFLVGRRIPESWRSRFFPKKLLQLQDAVAQGGFTTLLLLRLTPLPFADTCGTRPPHSCRFAAGTCVRHRYKPGTGLGLFAARGTV